MPIDCLFFNDFEESMPTNNPKTEHVKKEEGWRITPP